MSKGRREEPLASVYARRVDSSWREASAFRSWIVGLSVISVTRGLVSVVY